MVLKTGLKTVAALLLVLSLAALYGRLWFLHYQPDRDRYPSRGIDVSHHQGYINWPEVAADDVAFAYLKATEGGDHQDRRFAENWNAARAVGIPTGAYHFFTFCRSGGEQAGNFIAAVPRMADALPPAIDLEFGGNCGKSLSGAEMRRELDAFLAPVEAVYGKPAILYVTPEFLAAYSDDLPDRRLWRRSILHTPDATAIWAIWQYHNRGRVRGIAGPVDLNVSAGGLQAFAAYRQAVPR